MIQGHFEAKKHAYRQTDAGAVVSFVVHFNDIKPDFASAPLGTIFQVAYAEVNGEEIPTVATRLQSDEGGGAGVTPVVNASPLTKSRGERLLQRAGIYCNDPEFWEFIKASDNDDAREKLCLRLGVKSRRELLNNEAAQSEMENVIFQFNNYNNPTYDMRN